MGIKPIDLQTLFMQMREVGKEQSLIKEHAARQQSQAARSQVVRELEEDRKVTSTPDDKENEKIRDNESEEPPEGEKRRRHTRKNSDDDEKDIEVVTDPDIGRHVDVSG